MTNPFIFQLLLLLLAISPVEAIDRSELAAKIKNGDHGAFRTFFKQHHKALFRYLRSKNIAPSTAEDLIQQAFVYIWEHRNGINPGKSLRAYLFKIAYTRMLNHIRDNSKYDESEAVPNIETSRTPEDTTLELDLREAIEQAINDMPEKRGQVFELCFMEQLTYKEAASVMDLSVKTIENHMGLAFKDMREALQDFI